MKFDCHVRSDACTSLAGREPDQLLQVVGTGPLLANVDPADMPPPFRSLTPIPVHWVAAAVLDGVARRRARVVVPFQPRLLMVGDAFSPRYGDRVVRLLESKIFGRLIGSYRGSVYRHQPTESAKAQAAQPERGYSSAR